MIVVVVTKGILMFVKLFVVIVIECYCREIVTDILVN